MFVVLQVRGDCENVAVIAGVGETVMVESGGMTSGAGASVKVHSVHKTVDEALAACNELQKAIDAGTT